MLLTDVGQRVFDFLVGDGDFWMLGAEFFVALDDDLGEDFERRFEAQRFAVVNMQIGDLRLRRRFSDLP